MKRIALIIITLFSLSRNSYGQEFNLNEILAVHKMDVYDVNNYLSKKNFTLTKEYTQQTSQVFNWLNMPTGIKNSPLNTGIELSIKSDTAFTIYYFANSLHNDKILAQLTQLQARKIKSWHDNHGFTSLYLIPDYYIVLIAKPSETVKLTSYSVGIIDKNNIKALGRKYRHFIVNEVN
jgi:hypothetical protein